MKKRISNYLDYIIARGINTKSKNIEIVTSSYINDILSQLIKKLSNYHVTITYIDGDELEEEINRDWRSYLDKRINKYKTLIKEGFSRITLLSPFLFPIPRTNNTDLYKAHLSEIMFVADYFYNGESTHTTAVVPNLYWASKLQITLDELWDRVLNLYLLDNPLLSYKDRIASFRPTEIIFKTALGTNLSVGLIKDAPILFKVWKDKNGTLYEPNIPSLEIYTSPDKYKLNGTLISSRPLFYKGRLISEYSLKFKDGRVVECKGLDDILSLDPNLYYAGEIALVMPRDDRIYYNTLLDENLGCHLALGCGFLNQIDSPLVNRANYHIDLVFGTSDIDVTIKNEDSEVMIFKGGILNKEDMDALL